MQWLKKKEESKPSMFYCEHESNRKNDKQLFSDRRKDPSMVVSAIGGLRWQE